MNKSQTLAELQTHVEENLSSAFSEYLGDMIGIYLNDEDEKDLVRVCVSFLKGRGYIVDGFVRKEW